MIDYCKGKMKLNLSDLAELMKKSIEVPQQMILIEISMGEINTTLHLLLLLDFHLNTFTQWMIKSDKMNWKR